MSTNLSMNDKKMIGEVFEFAENGLKLTGSLVQAWIEHRLEKLQIFIRVLKALFELLPAEQSIFNKVHQINNAQSKLNQMIKLPSADASETVRREKKTIRGGRLEK